MADLAQIEKALRAADAAGNKEDAARLAQAYVQARGQTQAPQQAPPQAAPQGQGGDWADTAADMLNAVPGGVAKGIAGITGLPGDLASMVEGGARWAGDKLGVPASVMDMKVPGTHDARLPTSGDFNNAFSAPTGGYYKPKTKAGQYAETIASFAPNALAPGSAAARMARVLVPGATSEAAGQLAKDKFPKYEGLARAGGALAGGIGTGLGEALLSHKAPIPSLEELGKAQDAAYKAADNAGVVIAPQSFQKFATDLGTDITRNNVVQANIHPQTLAAIDTIQQEAASGIPLSLSRADAIRKAVNGAIGTAVKTGNDDDVRIAGQVKRGLDAYLDGLSPADTVVGDASVAVPILKEARSLARKEFKGEEIQKLIDLAENQAGGNNSALGKGQALRQQFKNFNATLIKNENLAKSFTPAERKAIEQVVHGGSGENALRLVGKLAPTNNISMGVGPSLGAGIGAAIGGGPLGAMIGAAAVPAVGAAARGGASLLTQRNAKMAAALMRSGVPQQQTKMAPKLMADILLSQTAH